MKHQPMADFWRELYASTRAMHIGEYVHVRNMRRKFGPRSDYATRLQHARKEALMNAAELRRLK